MCLVAGLSPWECLCCPGGNFQGEEQRHETGGAEGPPQGWPGGWEWPALSPSSIHPSAHYLSIHSSICPSIHLPSRNDPPPMIHPRLLYPYIQPASLPLLKIALFYSFFKPQLYVPSSMQPSRFFRHSTRPRPDPMEQRANVSALAAPGLALRLLRELAVPV